MGAKYAKADPVRPKVTPVDLHQLRLVFGKTKSIGGTARVLRMHTQRVAKALESIGLYQCETREVREARLARERDALDAQCVFLFDELGTALAIARKIGRRPATVCAALRRRGVALYSHNHPRDMSDDVAEARLAAWEREPLVPDVPLAAWRCFECAAPVRAGKHMCPKGHVAPFLQSVA